MQNKIRVGIIGAHPERGWAAIAHIPALKALPDYELKAISNRNPGKAAEAAKAAGIPLIFEDNLALINSPEIDLVVVSVKVPEHRALVTAAINAGKMIYCEWPLGNGLEETIELTELAAAKNIRGIIGLQTRTAPSISYIKDLISQGYIGEVLSTTMIGSGIIYGALTEQAMAYTVDIKNGAGMIYATFGHAVDALCYVLGEFDTLNATTANRRKSTTIIESGETIPMTAYDQIAITGKLQSGAVAAVHYRGGMFKGTNFHWEINGTDGDLVITSPIGHPAVMQLTIKGSHKDGPLEVLEVPQQYNLVDLSPAAGPAYAVAHNYAALAKGLSPTFSDAVLRHKMIRAIELL